MAEIGPINNDFNLFKEEMLSLVNKLEKRLTEQMTSREEKSKIDFEHFSKKINSLIVKNKDMVSDLITQKIKLEKISEFETFKNKVDGMLITHEVRIKNTVDEIEKIKTKYDKIVADNLYVSGFIGNSCQFRNVSEYLSYNISEVSKIKLERDQFKKDIKELKNKIDSLMKNVITLNDNSVKLCNKYTDNKQAEFYKLLQSTTSELNQKSLDMRTMVVKFQAESENRIDNLKNEFDKLLHMKNELNEHINQRYKLFEIKFDELNRKATNNSQYIEINENKLENLKEENSNLDKKIKELSFLVRNYYFVSNKLAEMLEKLGANPSKSEITKLIYGSLQINGNATNPELNKNLSVSPQPKRKKTTQNINADLPKFCLDDVQPFNFNSVNNFYNNNLNDNVKRAKSKKSVNSIESPQKKNVASKIIGLKRVNFKDDDKNNTNIYSDKSSIEDEPINKNPINNMKQNFKNHNINNKINTNNTNNINNINITNDIKNQNNKNNTNDISNQNSHFKLPCGCNFCSLQHLENFFKKLVKYNLTYNYKCICAFEYNPFQTFQLCNNILNNNRIYKSHEAYFKHLAYIFKDLWCKCGHNDNKLIPISVDESNNNFHYLCENCAKIKNIHINNILDCIICNKKHIYIYNN